MESYIQINDKILISLGIIAEEIDTEDLEDAIEYLVEGYGMFKDQMKKKIKLKRRRGF